MGPKSPFLPLFFVNYWKFFQGIFSPFSPLFRPENRSGVSVFVRKSTRSRVFQYPVFSYSPPFFRQKITPEKQFPATMFLTKAPFAVIIFLL